MDQSIETEVRKLIAERDIRQQLFRYQEAINRADFAGLEAFFGDAKIATVAASNPDELHGVVNGGKQFAGGFQRSVHFYDGSPRVQYCASNLIIQLNDAVDTATCHAYYFIFQALGDHDYQNSGKPREFPLQVIGAGRYLDTFKHLNGKWKIVEREIYSDLSGDYSKHMRQSPMEMAEEKGYLKQQAASDLKPRVRTGPISAMRAPR